MIKLTLRQVVAKMPCVACPPIPREEVEWIQDNLEQAPRRSDPHHVTTRGAGGKDVPTNLMPLCRKHHDEWDAPWGGPSHMVNTYPGVRSWLIVAGRLELLEKYQKQVYRGKLPH